MQFLKKYALLVLFAAFLVVFSVVDIFISNRTFSEMENRYLTDSIESALTMAKACFGYTLYPDIPSAREPGLCYIPVTDLPKVSFGVYFRHNNDHPVLKRFISLMPQMLRDG